MEQLKKEVTTVTPMKRGLKDVMSLEARKKMQGYNRYPDEKGTESEKDTSRRVSALRLQPLPR